MIARHETQLDKTDIWSALAAPLAAAAISWRQDGRPVLRDGKHYARFLSYIDANTVRERLDAVVPGEWDLTLELLPPLPGDDERDARCAFKARLQILGVIREDVGTGRDYKSAATDAFKRAAVRFGVGHELYAMEPNWVQVDGDEGHAHPIENPQDAYVRRNGGHAVERGAAPAVAAPVARRNGRRAVAEPAATVLPIESPIDMPDFVEPSPAAAAAMADADAVRCPKCNGRTWDNRLSKRNPKAPDFKCRDRACDGVIWPAREGSRGGAKVPAAIAVEPEELSLDSSPLGGDDDIPF